MILHGDVLKTINIKLLRDLKATWGQAFAIVMVIAAGVATFIMSISTMDALVLTRDAYYSDYRFVDVFTSVNRAPESLRERIGAIDGVDKVETRVVAPVKLSVENFSDPIVGQVLSVPDYGEPLVNRLHIRKGRHIDPGRDDEVLLNEVFADAHNLQPGNKLEMIIKGRLQKLTVVGVALSPEFIYQVAPGSIMPDFKRFGVLWMARNVLGKAYEMDKAFNDVVLTVQAGANTDDVIQKLDLLLERYGGKDARERYWQVSHRIFKSDIDQLEQMATLFSAIFLGIAAFLLNVVVNRLISTQRELIAALKSFGYSNLDVGLHYLGYVTLIVIAGLLIGTAAGVWLGQGLSEVYMEFYRLPYLEYELHPEILIIASVITFLAASLGTLFAVNQAVKLPPAQAMRPEPPAKYSKSIIERVGLGRFLSQALRMIIRHIERKPFKASLSIIGIALACGIMVVGTFFRDAIEFMIDIEFGLAQRQDITVTFVEPTSFDAFYELQRMPGVEYGEVFRSVPVRLRNEHHSYLTSINAYGNNRDLYRSLNTQHEPIEIPKEGVLLSDHLGKLLNVKTGDNIIIEVLEGRRPVKTIQVAGLVSQYIGVAAYMDLNSLNRLMHEGDAISGAYLKIDPAYENQIYSELRDMPQVANSEARKNIINAFYESSAEFILIFVGFISLMAGIITFGVVYNTARIALSERSRDLASMRVLGFTKAEISFILLGELAILTLVAIPIGLLMGKMMSWYMIQEIPQDIFRIPLIIEYPTYALAATVVIIASLLSSLVVRSKLDHLDLIAVLKTKE
jgi:putative ABC transport system permease protein